MGTSNSCENVQRIGDILRLAAMLRVVSQRCTSVTVPMAMPSLPSAFLPAVVVTPAGGGQCEPIAADVFVPAVNPQGGTLSRRAAPRIRAETYRGT